MPSDHKNPSWLADGMPHIWLPYTQMQGATLPLPVVATQGSTLTLADGRVLVDGVASWWTACHGYNHPHIRQAMEKQLTAMPHVMFGGLAHEGAMTLAARLAKMAPVNGARVFFSDSGSTAVEVALKMALQYWRNKGVKNRGHFLCFRHGYHGDTLGAMSISDPESPYHRPYEGVTHKQYVIDIPSDEYAFAEFDEMLTGLGKGIAAAIIEPLVQGAGGMKFHGADVLAEIHRICKKHEILFIADEIATGFGRTGMMFACEEAGILPDILCLGKALTGGTMTLAATLASDEVFAAFLGEEHGKALMHGPTYMANPLACAAANASLDLFAREPRLKQVEAIEAGLQAGLAGCEGLPGVVDMRVKGAIGVVQLEGAFMAAHKARLKAALVERGVWLRPLEDVIYILPALTISEKELGMLTKAVVATLSSLETRPD